MSDHGGHHPVGRRTRIAIGGCIAAPVLVFGVALGLGELLGSDDSPFDSWDELSVWNRLGNQIKFEGCGASVHEDHLISVASTDYCILVAGGVMGSLGIDAPATVDGLLVADLRGDEYEVEVEETAPGYWQFTFRER